MLDTLRQVETPEGLTLDLRTAGVVPRAYAWLLDLGIRFAGVSVLSSILAILGEAGTGVLLVAMFLVYWGYPVAFEVLFDGQTPGKRVMGLRVVNANGTPVTWLPSVVRNLLRTVDMLPFGYGLGLASALLDDHGRRLGDHAAGTLVVHAERERPRAPAPPVTPQASPVPLRQDEQVAIVAFAERSAQMTPERQAELAGLLEPLTGERGDAAVQRVLGLANHLLGRR
jgi:uncharacterized RDD family membrane protein YckC